MPAFSSMKTRMSVALTAERFQTTLRTNTLGALLVSQRSALPEKERQPADRQCFQWRRTTGRRRRRLGARLLHFQDGAERRHRPARRRPAGLCGQLRLSRLGANWIWVGQTRHVPLEKAHPELSGCGGCATTRNGKVLARPQSDPVVIVKALSKQATTFGAKRSPPTSRAGRNKEGAAPNRQRPRVPAPPGPAFPSARPRP